MYQKTGLGGFLLAPAFFAFASTVLAQPDMSRGEQRLSINYEECMRRAENAFAKEGWVNIGKGGAFVNAFKENHEAYIMCNVAPENKIWVNIVVASSPGDAGAERVKLQGRMDQSVAGGGFGGNWSAKDWGDIAIQQSGNQLTARYTGPAGGFSGRVEGNRMTVFWKNDQSGREGEAHFILKSDGSLEGKWCSGRGCNPENGTSFTGSKR